MAALDQLIEDLRADGALDSEGRFTLDREQARAKMQKFQLVDARRYVLELVQAAVLRDATAIAFDIDADDMRLRFDGQPFSEAEVDDLYGSLFAEGDTRALRGVRQLALALNAALGMDPKYIHMRSGVVELRMAPGKRDEIIVHDKSVAHTQIHVRQRLRMRVFVDFFLDFAGRIAEEQYLRERCVYSTVPVSLDGKQISVGLGEGERGLAKLAIRGDDFRGVMKIVDEAAHCQVRLVKDGVWIDNRELRACGTNLIAVIEGDNLRKDVSQAKIVATAALERIDAALTRTRWSLWKLARDNLQGGEAIRVRSMIREQLLEYASFAELQEGPEVRALAAELRWADCRDANRQVSLQELVDRTVAGEIPRFATQTFDELSADGQPIVQIIAREDIDLLGRALERELVQANSLLARARRREIGRRAWAARKGEPELPTHLSFAVRGSIDLTLDSGPIRGEVGVDAQMLSNPDIAAPVHLFMYKDGCLLGRTELDLELPNLWLALDAGFEPNDDYSDATRDLAFVAILLQGLAALREPFARLLAEVQDHNAALVRGLVKRWLMGLVDKKSQIALLTRAGVDVAPNFFVATKQLLPGLTGKRLQSEQAASDEIAAAPMFETLDGAWLSLAQIGQLIRANEKLRYTESRPKDARLTQPGVLVLGPGDRKIIRGLFGGKCLEEWDPGPKQRELEFWDKPQRDLSSVRLEVEREIAVSGVVVDHWIADLHRGSTRGFVYLTCADGRFDEVDEIDGVDEILVDIRLEGRDLCKVEIEGFGPVSAVVERRGLQPTPSWDDVVVHDAAYDEAIAAVRRASHELYRRACVGFEREGAATRRWLARVLLHGAATVPELRELADDVPLLTTVNGKTFGLARAAARVREHGKLEYVGRDVGWAPISDPPVIVADDSECDDLQALLGDVLEDGSARVRHHRVYDLLDDRPELREAKLDAEQTLVRLEIRGDSQVGEVGLSSCRDNPGLSLELGVAGRSVETLFEEKEFFVAIDAVVIDEELPLDSKGNVERRSKRIKGLVRQCRRRLPQLILALCERWPELSGDERDAAWRVLVSHLRHEAGQERRKIREQAFDAAAAVPGFRDVRGRRRSLRQLLVGSRSRPVDVLTGKKFAQLRLDLPELNRPIVIVTADERDCLDAHADLRELDDVWDEELAAIKALASKPKVEVPNIHETAIVYRKAMVAGGLECELWLPRAGSLFESDPPELIFVRRDRELARGHVGDALPCAGIVRGEGLDVRGGKVELEHRQRASLERQQVILYGDLAKLVANDQVARADHERALEYLAWASFQLVEAPNKLSAHGKHATALRWELERVVPPSLRAAVGRHLGGAAEAKAAPAPAPSAADLEPSGSAQVPRPEPPERERSVEPKPVEAAPRPLLTPEQRLLAAVYEQLHWARARHELVERLLLDKLQIRAWGAGEIALLDRNLLTINRDHPIVARLLGQEVHDLIDLSFLVAALYSLVNYEAEEISDDDERLFVGRLAEALALSLRADGARRALDL